MKKISRLTAFVLALLMLLQTAAFAEGGVLLDDFDYSSYEGMLMSALEKRGPLVNEGGTLTDAAKYLPEQKKLFVYESTEYQGLNVTTAGNEETVQVSLPEKGMVQLSVAAEGGHWQVQVLDQWVDIAGETGATCDITYAKVKNLFDLNGGANVRWLSADGQSVSQIASIALKASDAPATQAAPVQNAVVYADDTNDANDTNNDTGRHTFNIVINYVFENGTVAADPYTANLAKGSSFSQTITFPTVMGYLPYVRDVQQNSYELNYPSVDADDTITVTYKPTLVDYTIIYHQQNIDNDDYAEVYRETLKGLTKSQVPEITRKYEGFYSLVYERPEIAADGSTIIDVYYDRYYYLMNFDLDGGYGVDPIYARYGAKIGTVGTPTKTGYTFGGWSETKGGTTKIDSLPTTMPSENKTYYAIWNPVATAKVTVVFWGENADDEEYSYMADQTKVIDLVPGTKFTYSESGMLVCTKEEHTHTEECLGCGKIEHTHTAVGGSCYTLTCGMAIHTHGTSCYANVGNQAYYVWGTPPSNPQSGQVYVYNNQRKYIYIDGQWYRYTGNLSNGTIAQSTCGQQEHAAHSDSCYTLTCTTEEHTHDSTCYICGKEEHTHNSNCYKQGAGLDSTLWKFVKSDTITVAADGSSVVNVYYDRVEYSVQFYENQSCSASREYTNLKITAKWGAHILDKWPEYNGSKSWYVKDKSNTWQNSIQVMPVGGAKFWGPKTGYDSYKAYYYVEALPGAVDTVYYKGKYYVLHHVDQSVSSGSVTDEERYAIDGFTYVGGTENGESYKDAKFYYDRNVYSLVFNNQETDERTESVQYEALLDSYADYVPTVIPSWYEPGSVKFDGWYQNPECTGQKYDLSGKKMPAKSVILYAKWVPVTHHVEFHLTENHEEVYRPTGAEEASFTVAHGGNIAKDYVEGHLTKEKMNEAKPNGDYKFVVWYYYDENGDEQYFDPTMQIRQDMVLYGKWSSDTLKQYTVRYVLKDDPNTEVADDLTGSGLAGTTKTFDAKGGTDLYPDYQEGYFPTVKSSSLILDIEKDELVLTFEYVRAPAVPYTVKYINTETGDSIFDGVGLVDDKVVSDNVKAVVTETFKVIPGYMPDAYQKRLVVTADGENILYFYYTKDSHHAYYKITHYTENLATDAQGNTTWTEYASSQAKGDIGETYTADAMTIPGFTFDKMVEGTLESGKLTEDGLELKLYYRRNKYPYQVRYLEEGTGKVLSTPKNSTGKYQQVISEKALDITDYVLVSDSPATLTIRIEEGDEAKLNVITFYYKQKEATIKYVPVGPEGLDATTGEPNPTVAGSVLREEETVKILTGTAQGSTAAANTPGYRFVGWYEDAECTKLISTDEKFVPTRPDSTIVDGVATGGKWPETGLTYYAKFEATTGDLTIIKKGYTHDDASLDPNQSFLFYITDTKGFHMEVVICGNGHVTIKDLPAGTYTVREEQNWSWRYTPEEASQITTVTGGETAKVTFTNNRTNGKWLDGNDYCENEWKNNWSN